MTRLTQNPILGWIDRYRLVAAGLAIVVLLTIPGLMILIIVASMIGSVTIESVALIIAALAWMWPARTVRAQVLTIRERMYVQVAKLNGAGSLKIIVRELLPNLLPYL